MEAKGIKPTQVTYSVTISALGNGLQWERALWLLNLMRDKGMSVNLYTYNAGKGETLLLRVLVGRQDSTKSYRWIWQGFLLQRFFLLF